jgi:hypothetical protein
MCSLAIPSYKMNSNLSFSNTSSESVLFEHEWNKEMITMEISRVIRILNLIIIAIIMDIQVLTKHIKYTIVYAPKEYNKIAQGYKNPGY